MVGIILGVAIGISIVTNAAIKIIREVRNGKKKDQ